MDNFVQTVYQKFLNELAAAPALKNVGVKNPIAVGDLVRRCMTELKDHFGLNPFQDTRAEINFFKYGKPAIIAEFIYARELFTIESNKPAGDRELTENYYTRELAFIRRFLDQYRFLYQYFQLDGEEFDELYFCRGSRPIEVPLPVAPDFDPLFSTPGDFLFAMFSAYERLQEFLIDELYRGKPESNRQSGDMLLWTGDVINLVELIYGLNLTGQVNHGNASLNEIVRWAEEIFGVKIGVVQRRFAEIQSRKRISPTKFLDQMRNSVQEKIDEMAA